MLWSSGVSSPKALLAIFLNGNFCLQGGQEPRDLKLSQDSRQTTEQCKKFSTTTRGLKNLRRENKVVRRYACKLRHIMYFGGNSSH